MAPSAHETIAVRARPHRAVLVRDRRRPHRHHRAQDSIDSVSNHPVPTDAVPTSTIGVVPIVPPSNLTVHGPISAAGSPSRQRVHFQ
ncbi:hypothetical protein QJS10_CPB04g02023 [Acorus calamus]|uniref:Uncharacterized protein n=1 Tax=Acorus calamus TaxID=4465 RepID=A0AAV9F2P8_ACOCL|nr:hypothetical protein QJS10_CPB04g02023 [Acorus calamus]